MKKTIFTIILSSIICSAFAQQTFKPIHFTSMMETHWRPLDFNSESNGPDRRISGVININTTDSVILISPDQQPVLKYKIISITPEEEDKSARKKTINFTCKDSDGKECDTKIERVKSGSSPYMKVSVIYRASLMAYFCDYVKKLY